MYLLAWIAIGAVVGWGTGKVFQGDGYGPFMDILTGIGGAVVGGLLMRSAGFVRYGGTVTTALVAMVGAVLVTMLAAYVNGKRVYVRQL
jgi:uncharacterized membrane protein YeaQ/YmgE (transglycosylase-associated protein family)